MIDTLTLALTHGLMVVAAWRLISRPDLEDDAAGTASVSRWPTRPPQD